MVEQAMATEGQRAAIARTLERAGIARGDDAAAALLRQLPRGLDYLIAQGLTSKKASAAWAEVGTILAGGGAAAERVESEAVRTALGAEALARGYHLVPAGRQEVVGPRLVFVDLDGASHDVAVVVDPNVGGQRALLAKLNADGQTVDVGDTVRVGREDLEAIHRRMEEILGRLAQIDGAELTPTLSKAEAFVCHHCSASVSPVGALAVNDTNLAGTLGLECGDLVHLRVEMAAGAPTAAGVRLCGPLGVAVLTGAAEAAATLHERRGRVVLEALASAEVGVLDREGDGVRLILERPDADNVREVAQLLGVKDADLDRVVNDIVTGLAAANLAAERVHDNLGGGEGTGGGTSEGHSEGAGGDEPRA